MENQKRIPGRLAMNPFFRDGRQPKQKQKPKTYHTDAEKRDILGDIEMKLRNGWGRLEAIKSSGITDSQYYVWRREI